MQPTQFFFLDAFFVGISGPRLHGYAVFYTKSPKPDPVFVGKATASAKTPGPDSGKLNYCTDTIRLMPETDQP